MIQLADATKRIRDNLTRKQLARLHGVSPGRITQWVCLLELPEETQKEIDALGDHWDRLSSLSENSEN